MDVEKFSMFIGLGLAGWVGRCLVVGVETNFSDQLRTKLIKNSK